MPVLDSCVKNKKFTLEQQQIYDTLEIKLRSCLPENISFELLRCTFEEIANNHKPAILNMELNEKLKEKLIDSKTIKIKL